MPLPTGTTGQGTTVSLTTGGSVACVRSITMPSFSIDAIDASCLSDTGFMKKISADLVDGGTVQVTAVFPLGGDIATVNGDQDTITVTLPDGGALSGSGFVSEATLPSVEIGGLLESTLTFTFDGMTGPTYSAGSAPAE